MNTAKFDALLLEISNVAKLRGGWAALWQSDTIALRLRDAIGESAAMGLPRYAIMFDALFFAVRGWGDLPVNAPNPEIQDIVAQAGMVDAPSFDFDSSRYEIAA